MPISYSVIFAYSRSNNTPNRPEWRLKGAPEHDFHTARILMERRRTSRSLAGVLFSQSRLRINNLSALRQRNAGVIHIPGLCCLHSVSCPGAWWSNEGIVGKFSEVSI